MNWELSPIFLILFSRKPLHYLCLKKRLKPKYYGNNNHYRRIHQSNGRRIEIQLQSLPKGWRTFWRTSTLLYGRRFFSIRRLVARTLVPGRDGLPFRWAQRRQDNPRYANRQRTKQTRSQDTLFRLRERCTPIQVKIQDRQVQLQHWRRRIHRQTTKPQLFHCTAR